MESQHEEIEAAGLAVVAVGLGQPKHAERFCGTMAPSISCLTNEKPDLNRTYGLMRGSLVSIMMTPSAIANGARAVRAGFKQGKSTGDVLMLPGTFVIDEQGVVLYAHYGENAGDHPDISELIAQITPELA